MGRPFPFSCTPLFCQLFPDCGQSLTTLMLPHCSLEPRKQLVNLLLVAALVTTLWLSHSRSTMIWVRNSTPCPCSKEIHHLLLKDRHMRSTDLCPFVKQFAVMQIRSNSHRNHFNNFLLCALALKYLVMLSSPFKLIR